MVPFKQLDNYSANMKSFKTPEPVKHRKEVQIPKSNISGSKDYFSRSSESEPPSRRSFLANSYDYFLKYKNLTSNGKSQSVDSLDKSMSTSNTNDEYKGGARVRNSYIKENRTNSVTSSSSSFITDYAKVTSTLSGNLQANISSLSLKSNCSPFRGFSDSSLQIRQEGGGKERDTSLHCQNASDKENLERNITITPRNDGLTCAKIDTCIALDASTDDDEYIPVLRSTSAREASPINIGDTSLSKNNGKNTSNNIGNVLFPKISINNKNLEDVQNNGFPSLLGGESDSSDMSDVCPPRPDISRVRRFSKQLEKVPIPGYESDNSIIEDSQPKITGNKLLPRLSTESFKSGSEKFLSDKTTPIQSSPWSKSEEEFFITNKKRRFSKYSIQSVAHSDSDSSQVDFPKTGNKIKDRFERSSVQSCQEDSFMPKFVSKQSTKNDQLSSDSKELKKLESMGYTEIPSTFKDYTSKTMTDVLRPNSSDGSASEFICQRVPADLAVVSNKTSGIQIKKKLVNEFFKQEPKVMIKSGLKPSSSWSKTSFPKATVVANDTLTLDDSSPIRKNSTTSLYEVLNVDLCNNTSFENKDLQNDCNLSSCKFTDVIENMKRSGKSKFTNVDFEKVTKRAGMTSNGNKLFSPCVKSIDHKQDQIHLPPNEVKEVKLDKSTSAVKAEKQFIRESQSEPRHSRLHSDESTNQARSVNGKDKFERKNSVGRHFKNIDCKLNVPCIKTEVTYPKTSRLIQSQNSAFKPAIPMSKPVSNTENFHLKKCKVNDPLTVSKISPKKLNMVHEIYGKQSISPRILFANPEVKKSEKMFKADNVTSKDLAVNLCPINPNNLNVNLQEKDNHRKGLTRPVIKVEETACPKIDNQSRLYLPTNSSTFRPISCGTTPAQCASRVASSMRSTDASSKMELEQIFHHCNTTKSVIKTNVTSLHAQEKRKPTPFTRQASSRFINKAVKVVQDLGPINMIPNPLISESTAPSVDKSDIPENDSLEVNKKNEADTIVSRHDSSRMTVPASSGSDSSLFMSPYEGGSNNLNFTRLANTDANNNTLVGKKNLLKECSPVVLPMTKPSKTYLRKRVIKPNHSWFQTTDNKKKNPNKLSVARPIRKKKLFHLPSNYQQLNLGDSTSVKVSRISLQSDPLINKDLKKVSSTLYDIKELDESFEAESEAPEIKEEIDEVMNNNSRVRRSTRNRKRINYKEISDTETEKSLTLKNNKPTVRQNEATLIKQIILKHTEKNATESSLTSLPAKGRKIIKMNSNGELIATEGNILKNTIFKKSEKTRRNNTAPAESETNQIDLTLEPELNSNYTTETVKDISSSKPISKLTAKDQLGEKACYNLDSTSERTKGDSHRDIFDFDDEATESLELRGIPLIKKTDSFDRQRKLKKCNIEANKVQPTSNNTEVYDDKRSTSSNLKRAKDFSSKIQLKKIKTDEDSPLSDGGNRNNETKSGRTSSTDSIRMETITVEAMVHHPCDHTVKSRPKIGTTAEIHSKTEEAIECCDAVKEESSNISLQNGLQEEGDQNTTLLSLVNSIKEQISRLSDDFNKLVDVVNPSK